MLSTYTTESNIEEACLSEEEVYVFLDSCASSTLFIIRDQSCLESFVYSGGAIQLTLQLEYSWSVKGLGNIKIGLIYVCVLKRLIKFDLLVCCVK